MRVIAIVQRTHLKVGAILLLHYKSPQVRSKVGFSVDIIIPPTAAASRARPLNKCKITFENLFNYILNSHGLELNVRGILLFIV